MKLRIICVWAGYVCVFEDNIRRLLAAYFLLSTSRNGKKNLLYLHSVTQGKLIICQTGLFALIIFIHDSPSSDLAVETGKYRVGTMITIVISFIPYR